MNIKLLDNKELKDFSPGPAIESFDDHLYLIGHDARHILVMNRNWKIQETISLFASDTFRMNKERMPYFEASTFIVINKLPFILMIGAGSTEADGNAAILMNLHTRTTEELDLTVFYERLKQSGSGALNIKAVTVLNDKLILCNGANNINGENNIIITSLDFWNDQHLADILTVKIELEGKAGKFMALSGLTYSYENDWLISTISSRDTNKLIDDGSSGECYVGVVEGASRKIGRKRFKVNKYFNLAEISRKLKGQQVQSLCIQEDKKEKIKLHLVCGNGKGEHFLNKLRLKE